MAKNMNYDVLISWFEINLFDPLVLVYFYTIFKSWE